MQFGQDVIQSIEDNPIQGIVDICKYSRDKASELVGSGSWNEDVHELFWETVSLLELAIEHSQVDIEIETPEATGSIQDNCNRIWDYLDKIQGVFEGHSVALKIESYKGRYKAAFKSSFAYEFSQGDLDRIQTLVNELREHISNNEILDSSHKQRLLKRLEQLQSELHKRVSDLDRFWGMVGDAGVVLGKLGTDSKPIVDRVKEVAEIVWKTQARTEELPSNSHNPMLGHEEKT